MSKTAPRVLVVAEHASAQFGGEAILPLHYFNFLRKRGVDTWMIVHERTREELLARFPNDADRLHFVEDTDTHRALWRGVSALPARLGEPTLGVVLRLLSQREARRMAERLIREKQIDVVHQPIPVSPREPSSLRDIGAPVVIGPMNGGMTFPPAFRKMDGPVTRLVVPAARLGARLANMVISGKREADTLLVANARTGAALPMHGQARVIELPENGVDLSLWSPTTEAPEPGPPRFVFLGRLVDWKGVDILLDAFAQATKQADARLEIAGDGPDRAALEAQAERLGIKDKVTFSGWVPQKEIPPRLQKAAALVLPSVYECGGAVVLESMACGVPVIATAWGGPADYLDDACGVLVPVDDRASLVDGFARAIVRLAQSPELRRQMGVAGRRRIEESFDWERKVDRILEIYADAIGRYRARA